MKLMRVRLLDHYASIDEDRDKNFYLTVTGWKVGYHKHYTKLCMILGNEGEPHAPYMNILTRDIVSKEVVHEKSRARLHKNVGKVGKRTPSK
jgi:hypothetical protein